MTSLDRFQITTSRSGTNELRCDHHPDQLLAVWHDTMPLPQILKFAFAHNLEHHGTEPLALSGAQHTTLRGAAEHEVWRAEHGNQWHGPQQGRAAHRVCTITVAKLMNLGLLTEGPPEEGCVYAEPTGAGRSVLAERED